MKLLLVHNSYQQPGGEDQVFALEASLLRARGHEVVQYHSSNDVVREKSPFRLLGDTLWNRDAHERIAEIIRRERPELMHVHNTFPVISPSIYYAAGELGVPVVQTLHNYRLVCPAATLFRDGHVCEDCLGKTVPWPGAAHACYRGSRPASAVTAAMLAFHRLRGTWTDAITAYIALTEFARSKFVAGGLPAEKIFVKPNALAADPGEGDGSGGYALFLGRLTPEKGIQSMLDAWRHLGSTLPFEIAGDGPMMSEVREAAQTNPSLRVLGWLNREQMLAKLKHATMMIMPSVWYEPFGLSVIEAFAVGLPVIASKLGSMASLIDHGRTGLHFAPGDPADLARQVRWLLAHEDARLEMRRQARAEFEQHYTGEKNCAELVGIYQQVLAGRHGPKQVTVAESSGVVA